MGNNNVKKECEDACEKKITELFSFLSNNTSRVSYRDLKKAWLPQLDPYLYNIIECYFRKQCGNELTKDVFKNFFMDLMKSDHETKSKNVLRLITDSARVSETVLSQFIVSTLKSVFQIQHVKSSKNYNSWSGRISGRKDDSLECYGRYFLNLVDNNSSKTDFDSGDIANLLIHFDMYLSMILASMYQTESEKYFAYLLPRWKYESIDFGKKLEDISVLDLVKVVFINLELPIDYQNEWRLLFSSSINGESFSKLSAQIINRGPTVIIVKDKGGNVFGGFAPQSWNFSPNFTGDSRSFLFTLIPEMRVFSPTGYNSNYQYMNVGQQTMPNGLGMGGKLDYFGLWLSADYGSGYCSESCTTYRNYKIMSSVKNFSLSHVEIWSVGPPPPTAAELGERSCLDGNLEAKAILEMAEEKVPCLRQARPEGMPAREIVDIKRYLRLEFAFVSAQMNRLVLKVARSSEKSKEITFLPVSHSQLPSKTVAENV